MDQHCLSATSIAFGAAARKRTCTGAVHSLGIPGAATLALAESKTEAARPDGDPPSRVGPQQSGHA